LEPHVERVAAPAADDRAVQPDGVDGLGGLAGPALDLLGGQLADPVGALVRVLGASRQRRPGDQQRAHGARQHGTATAGTARGDRSHRCGCLSDGDLNGVPQSTGGRGDGWSQSVRTGPRSTTDRDGLACSPPERAIRTENAARSTRPRTTPHAKEPPPWQRAPPGSSSRTSPASPCSTRTATRWGACAIWSSCCGSAGALPGCSAWWSNCPPGAASSCP